MTRQILIIGEVFVDYSPASSCDDRRIRLGGIVHAARGLWAIGAPFSVAAVCPDYLQDIAMSTLQSLGCKNFIDLGRISGSPNLMAIRDQLETGNQGYEEIFWDKKKVNLNNVKRRLEKHSDILIFPGKYCLNEIQKMLPKKARFSFDIAYDVEDINVLSSFKTIETIMISTSSRLFINLTRKNKNIGKIMKSLKPKDVVLKENRGGTRIFRNDGKSIDYVPAELGVTRNSVGVGDAFSAAYAYLKIHDEDSAPYKAMKVSSAYAQTTSLDSLGERIRRSFNLSLEAMKEMGGVSLPWEERPSFSIYLASPDFSYQRSKHIDNVINSLEYHNFRVRRPVKENGELSTESKISDLWKAYRKDVNLLEECVLLFAIPTKKDPGTLVEIGMAIEKNIPVVVFDPESECYNTMVVAGAFCYSSSLDRCLNAVFTKLSDIRKSEI